MRSREAFTFEELIHREDRARGPKDAPELTVTIKGVATDEPWVQFTNRDRFGLALSGGGIRSASFNLGVLQTLAHKGVLGAIDYLSTVSGGGYIGGFYSALRKHHQGTEKPIQLLAQVRREASGEPHEIRHLRQFSRFLIPRAGITRLETWAGLLAVFGGMVPTLLLSASIVGLAVCLFIACSFMTISREAMIVSGLAFGPAMAALIENEWRKGRREPPPPEHHQWLLVGLQAGAVGGVVFLHWTGLLPWSWGPPNASLATHLQQVTVEAGGIRWSQFQLSNVLLSLAGLALLVRLVSSRVKQPAWHSHLDRAVIRFASLALFWALVAATWELSRWVRNEHFTIKVGASGVVTGGLFLWLREWLLQEPEENRLSGAVSKAVTFLKPAAPQLLALLAVLAFVVTGFAGFQELLTTFESKPEAWGLVALACASVLGLIGFAVETNSVGLNAFYRRRIARAFLGAVKADVNPPQTMGDSSDNFELRELKDIEGPVHLVCCTANGVSGDSLQTLGRGGRSVTLSAHGIAIGGFARPPRRMKLAAALSASGAAFNSQMGTLSLQLGYAVSLLMSAFNLRLGIWAKHPLARRRTFWQRAIAPLREWLAEARGDTRCDPVRDAEKLRDALTKKEAATLEASPDFAPLHLSDGGHFENLGLYELVRRHCRYIIVSDAGADGDSAFDDLGVAIRRVREDFCVEIDIDVTPLKPVDGLSKQQVVVGTIHYDGLGGSDKGTLLYMKPTLVGGEPPDVLQYHSRNASFPHEGTADQFYDEPQWESYRRLGEHVAAVALSKVVDATWDEKKQPVDQLFLALRQGWHAAPAEYAQTFLEYTNRCSELESEIRENAPAWFRAELFPEVGIALNVTPAGSKTEDELEARLDVVTWVMQIAQLMEDVWLAAKLDTYWSHPLNEGWMTYFHRWANTPSFRLWWPILRGIYSDPFRNFVKERFDIHLADMALRKKDDPTPVAVLELVRSWTSADEMGVALPEAEQRQTFQYVLSLGTPDRKERPHHAIPVASLAYELDATTKTARWSTSDFKVPSWLLGCGIHARFLDRVLLELKPKTERIEVNIEAGSRRDPASRGDLTRTIAFYKSRRFTYADGSTRLVYRPPAD